MPEKKKKAVNAAKVVKAATREQLAKAVSSHVSGDISEADVARILAAIDTVHDGEELGTVRRSEEGVVAIRVDFRGVDQWLVCGTNGSTHYDLSGSFDGEVIFKPEAE